MKALTGNLRGLISKHGFLGPWQCEKCGQLSQYADIRNAINRIFCRNPICGFCRVVDKRHHRIIEDDGSEWELDSEGNKRRVRARIDLVN